MKMDILLLNFDTSIRYELGTDYFKSTFKSMTSFF